MTYKISLSSVRVPDRAGELMMETLDKGIIAQSEYVYKFEEMLAEYLGVRYCIVVNNGTMADAVAIAAMKELYGIRRVVVPALTFIAQPNSVRYNGLEVVFADVRTNWLLDVRSVDRYEADTLFFATDLMGRVIDSKDYSNLLMIEDTCEAFGSKRNGKMAGTFGQCGTYSFFPSHTISTGEGGAIATNDEHIMLLCQSMRAHGSASNAPEDKFTFPYFGYNARMTTMQACLGISLMENIGTHVSDRRKVFLKMQDRIGSFLEYPGEEIIPHGYPIEFANEHSRDRAMRTILDAGIECRKFFSCIPTDERQYKREGKYPVAEHIAHTHLYLPCHQNMTTDDVDYVANVVNQLENRV